MMSEENWRHIQKQSREDILGMVMDFNNGRKTAGELMDKIAEHCQLAFKEGTKAVMEWIESDKYEVDQKACSLGDIPVFLIHKESWQAKVKEWE